jgi:ATP-dependent RNA helicase DeaD
MEFKVFKIVGGVDYDIQERVLRRGVDIIAGTPGRIIDLIERKWLNFDCLRTMILDEADEMLRMGFDEDVKKIYSYIMEDRE